MATRPERAFNAQLYFTDDPAPIISLRQFTQKNDKMGPGAKMPPFIGRSGRFITIVCMHRNGINEYHRLKMHLGVFCFIIVPKNDSILKTILRTRITCNNQKKIEDALLSCLSSTAPFCVNEWDYTAAKLLHHRAAIQSFHCVCHFPHLTVPRINMYTPFFFFPPVFVILLLFAPACLNLLRPCTLMRGHCILASLHLSTWFCST